ncbi:hypothetical protein CONPUDRAFT_137672 [Coniophora puteana RWD-64-598 SS2]|uniref:C2H2-type domain-containing protein n=1 Tax=Coniophora puteana (strain RWD-64-598) TaxID=741705 RepID=A0A5M3MN77_CONPW|nr:uncharacterized protein CONPUDRAFT_137672 [Coniophora puteana RWD-64-598 SS2]EIW80486.1 hypothetical protein CONPUDRAFT_137672 [Coniophora puteana RWD-64-598 SS2]
MSPRYTHAHGKRAGGEEGVEEGQKKTKKRPSTRRNCYPCPICRKESSRSSGLATHMNIHTGARPFECPMPTCDKRFAVRSNATRHLRTHGILTSARNRGFAVSFDKPIVSNNAIPTMPRPASYTFVPAGVPIPGSDWRPSQDHPPQGMNPST